jgi:hypothetical protein
MKRQIKKYQCPVCKLWYKESGRKSVNLGVKKIKAVI